MVMRAVVYGLALAVSVAISGPGVALDPSGETVGVDPDAEVNGVTGLRVVEIKGPIFMGDTITTDVNGRVQILFVDDTKFVVGANSKVIIDAFVFDANKTAQEVSISAVKGAFRFITGNSPKQNYLIKTPTMTIGVRGTALDLAVRAGTGESMLITHEGGTDVCDIIHRCMESNPGSMVVGSREGGLESVPPGADRTQRLTAYFPLLQEQDGLLTGFQVPIAGSYFSGDSNAAVDNARGDPTFVPLPPSPPPSQGNGRPPP
jgi:hypothetical protein